MSNFHSNYKDIHKQIAIADFTDEQIQELITALQIKRSAKSKLTKEEKVSRCKFKVPRLLFGSVLLD